jgi:hypothetical protein
MGTVFKAEHLFMERVVALKIIRRDLTDRPAAVERFRQEVKAAARLVHPHIVTAYDAEQAGDLHFLVMEFVEGKSLDRLLAQDSPIAISQACDWIQQAALGLQHAWEQGMVHRDIKPANLLLTPGGQVKILDFGLARFANEAASRAGLTPEGSMLGTPDYMAPEQADAAGNADIRADIYSLGCTLYHLLAGEPPFPEGAPLHKLLFHRSRQPTLLTEVRGDVPAKLAQVVQRMLAKDPAKRYQAPAEVARELAPFVEGEWATVPIRKRGPNSTPLLPPARRSVQPAAREPRARTFGARRMAAIAALLLVVSGLGASLVGHFLKHEGAAGAGGTVESTAPHIPQNGGPVVIAPPNIVAREQPKAVPVGEFRCIGGQNGKFTRVAFSPDCRRALGAGTDFVLQLWDLDKGEVMARLEGHTAEILGVAFSPDGKRALSGSKDLPGTLCLWDLEERRLARKLMGHRSWVRGVSFMPDEKYVLSGGNDASLRFWDSATGNSREFKGHVNVVGSVAVSRFGRFVASSGWDKTIRVWDLVENRQIHICRGHDGPVPTVTYSQDGLYLLSGSHDKTLRLWDIETERELRRFEGHTGPVNCVALSSDNRWALSGSDDQTVRLWNVERGEEVCTLPGHTAPVQGVAFCPEGRQAVSGAEDGTFRFWQLPPADDNAGKPLKPKP